jgi:anti-sigma-K factor RskA
MTEPRDSNELRELLGAYALGALDAEEHARVEDYVLHDADARAELHQLEHAVAWLGHASARPSAAAWDTVRREMARDLAAETDATPVSGATPGPAPVVDLASHRIRRSWTRLAAVAATVALVVALGMAALGVFSPPGTGARTTTVAMTAGGHVTVTARLHADGTGTIVMSSLPVAPAGHEYQLWSQPDADSSMQSAGVLGTRLDGRHIRVPPDTHLIAISVEPTGGSAAPTTTPVAVSRVDPI